MLDFKRRVLKRLPEQIVRDRLSRDGKIDHDIFCGHLARESGLRRASGHSRTTPGFRRLHLGEHLPASDPVLAATVGQSEERLGPDGRDPRSDRDCPANRRQSSPRQGRDGHHADRRGHWLLLQWPLPARRPGAWQGRAGREGRHHRGGTARLPCVPQERGSFRSTDSWRIGRDRFVKKLDLELDAGVSAEEALAEAQREADKVEIEMRVIARQLWGHFFPE